MVSKGRIISVFSPTGGQGVSFIATQIASQLAKSGSTCVVDLNAEFGSTISYLNLSPPDKQYKPFGKIEFESLKGEAKQLSQYAVKYENQFYALGAPDDSAIVTTEYVSTIVDKCRKEFQYTILDLPHSLTSSSVEEALKLSNLIMVIGDYSTVASLCKFNRLASATSFMPHDKLLYVINQSKRSPRIDKRIFLTSRITIVLAVCMVIAWSQHNPETVRAYAKLIAAGMVVILLIPLIYSLILRKALSRRQALAALSTEGIKVFHELPCDSKRCKIALNQGLLIPEGTAIGRELGNLANKLHSAL